MLVFSTFPAYIPTMSLSKDVPMESVSKMLGHISIKTTHIYVHIINKKIEHDMEKFIK